MFRFFFQAEDGIRDGHVTGVQTCALPISALSPIQVGKAGGRGCRANRALGPGVREPVAVGGRRSEERRVGKECRCRWWAGKQKKKVAGGARIMLAQGNNEEKIEREGTVAQ